MDDGIRQISLALCAVLLCGCGSDAAQVRYDDYTARLARSLKLDAIESPEPAVPARRPRKRDLVVALSDRRISLLDFLRLNECALGEVIGRQNSVLGKVAPASQRLFNDLDFLRLAPACLEKLRASRNDALAGTLADAIDIKRESLPKLIANATLASAEFSDLWRVPTTLGDFPASGADFLFAELRYVEAEVARWLSGDFRHDSVRFERTLGRLRQGKAGLFIAAAVLTHAELEFATRVVQSGREGQLLCGDGKLTNQGQIVRRVVENHFIEEIQPWLSQVDKLRDKLLAPYAALETQLAAARSPAYRQWQEERDAQLAWLSSATRRHVESLRPILASCRSAAGD